jgi:hypothetical protein
MNTISPLSRADRSAGRHRQHMKMMTKVSRSTILSLSTILSWEAQMRISTLARTKSAIILFVMLALASQYAFAQLPIETQRLRLQGATSGNAVILQVPSAVTNYTLTYPNAVGTGSGSFLFLGSSDGQFKWSSAVTTTGHIPVWDATADGGTGSIRWVGADSDLFPVWSLNGNTLAAADKKLGSLNSQPFDIVTDDDARVTFAANGDISINTANTGANTTIGRATGHTTTVNGTTNINGGANTGVTTIGNTAATSVDVLAVTATINFNGGTGVTNIGTGSTTGAVTVGGTGDQSITIGTGAAVKTVALGSNNTTSSTTILGGAGGTLDLNNNAAGSTTNIGSGTTAGTITVGGSANQTITIGAGAAVKTVALGSNNTTSTTTILSGATGALNVNVDNNSPTNINSGTSQGAVTIGGDAAQTITIGNGAAAKTVNLGSSNTTSATNILGGSGSVNVNVATNSNTNINTGASTSTIAIGNALSTTNVLGATNINTSGATLTSIGNSAGGADTRFSGEIQMETDPGDAGDVLLSQGAGSTPAWKDLNDAIGIRKIGFVTGLSAVLTSNVTAITNLAADDAIIITMEGSTSAVVPTVTARTTGASGSFTVTFSAAYTGSYSYMVMRKRD